MSAVKILHLDFSHSNVRTKHKITKCMTNNSKLFVFCSKKSLTFAPLVCTRIPPQKQLFEDSNSFTHYDSSSRSIEYNENSIDPSKTSSLSRGVSVIGSPTYHLLSNTASILRRDGLDKGGPLLFVNDL